MTNRSAIAHSWQKKKDDRASALRKVPLDKNYLTCNTQAYYVKELTDDLVPIVDSFLRSDLFINAYAIWDLHYLRHRSKFFVSIRGEKLVGLLLDYLSPGGFHFIWLWGEEKAIDKLLDAPLPNKMIFHVFPELERVIRQKFFITAKYPIDFMLLRKGHEHLCIQHEIRSLSLGDAYSLASLIGEPNEERLKIAENLIKEQFFYGIFIESRLISIACVQVKLPEIWILGGFYTKPEFRGRGYATSLASFLIKEAFKETDYIGLHVRADNYPAKRVYTKVGFQVYRKMCWLDYKTGLIP